MKKLSKKELEDLLAIMERNSIEYSVVNNSYEIRLIPEIQQACKQIKAMLQETEKAKLIWDATCPGKDKKWLPTAENINALPDPVRDYIAGLETNADPPSMVADNIIMKDTIKTLEKMLEERPTVDEFFEIKVAEYERGLKDAKASELPEITEAWTDAKAKEIKALVKDAQDEDLSDPVTSLHYLGLSLDIVTSIINDLRPKK